MWLVLWEHKPSQLPQKTKGVESTTQCCVLHPAPWQLAGTHPHTKRFSDSIQWHKLAASHYTVVTPFVLLLLLRQSDLAGWLADIASIIVPTFPFAGFLSHGTTFHGAVAMGGVAAANQAIKHNTI